MPRKLKTFQTSVGFYDLAVAEALMEPLQQKSFVGRSNELKREQAVGKSTARSEPD